jgi:hypothetical protein
MVAMGDSRQTNVVVGSLWMIGIALLLFFLPLINGLIGGFVGGRKVGTMGRALWSAVLPALVVGGGLWLILEIFDMPVLGAFAGLASMVVVLLSDLGILIGAAIGGATAQRRLVPAS